MLAHRVSSICYLHHAGILDQLPVLPVSKIPHCLDDLADEASRDDFNRPSGVSLLRTHPSTPFVFIPHWDTVLLTKIKNHPYVER